MKKTLTTGVLLLVIVLGINAQNTDASQFAKNGVYAEFYVIRPDFSDGFVSVN